MTANPSEFAADGLGDHPVSLCEWKLKKTRESGRALDKLSSFVVYLYLPYGGPAPKVNKQATEGVTRRLTPNRLDQGCEEDVFTDACKLGVGFLRRFDRHRRVCYTLAAWGEL